MVRDAELAEHASWHAPRWMQARVSEPLDKRAGFDLVSQIDSLPALHRKRCGRQSAPGFAGQASRSRRSNIRSARWAFTGTGATKRAAMERAREMRLSGHQARRYAAVDGFYKQLTGGVCDAQLPILVAVLLTKTCDRQRDRNHNTWPQIRCGSRHLARTYAAIEPWKGCLPRRR